MKKNFKFVGIQGLVFFFLLTLVYGVDYLIRYLKPRVQTGSSTEGPSGPFGLQAIGLPDELKFLLIIGGGFAVLLFLYRKFNFKWSAKAFWVCIASAGIDFLLFVFIALFYVLETGVDSL